jgi:O-Antigen ligase
VTSLPIDLRYLVRRRPPALVAVTLAAPLLVFLTMLGGGVRAGELLLAAIIVAAFVLAVARRPAAAFIGLLIWQPFSVLVLSAIYRLGAPARLVHYLGSVRDFVVIGIVIAALMNRRRRRVDTLDKVVIALTLVISAYLLLPYLAPGMFAGTTLNVRALAWRNDVEYLVLFIALRHAPIPADALRKTTYAVLGVSAVVAVGALVEFFASSTWNTFLVSTVRVQAYKNQVLHVPSNPADALVHGVVGSHAIIRVGSVLLSPLTLGFNLYLAWALSLRLLSGRRPQLWSLVAAGLVGAAILVTLTRSAVLGALVVALASVLLASRRHSRGRVRVGFLLLATAAVFAPLAGSTTLGQRTSEAAQGSDVSARAHVTAFRAGMDTIVQHPLGLGLGSQPGIGSRFGVNGTVTAEDYYLGLGDEVGLLSALLFIGVVVLVLVELRRRARAPGAVGSFAGAVWAAGVGLAIGALFLHIWLDIALSLSFWGVAALAVNDRWAAIQARAARPSA